MGDHYLPQMLLRHFCASDGRLWVARKGQDQPFQTKPRRVFAENDLNTQHSPVANPDGTGWTFRRDRSSEDALTQIEGVAADPIRQVITSARKQRLPQLGPDAQDALKRFFFATARRTPESQKRIRTPEAEARHVRGAKVGSGVIVGGLRWVWGGVVVATERRGARAAGRRGWGGGRRVWHRGWRGGHRGSPRRRCCGVGRS